MNPTLIRKKIHEVRDQKIMFDFDLADLYEVETRILNQAVRRNSDLFPEDFMFQLTTEEWMAMSSQIVMTSTKKRPKSALPLVFTEHGVAMLANVLRSKKARETSVTIIRVFIALRTHFHNYKELNEKLSNLEKLYNKKFRDIHEALNYLLQKDKNESDQKNRKKIGYK